MDKYKSTKDFLINQVTEVCSLFSLEDDKPVLFDAFSHFPEGKEFELFEGCFVTVYNRIYSSSNLLLSYEIVCRMLEGVTLPMHHHPDGSEDFFLDTGLLIDLVSGELLSAGVPFLFKENVSHHLKAILASSMVIYCKRI